MINKAIKITLCSIAIGFAGLLPGIVPGAFAYHVSGLVDFSYTDLTQKIGGKSIEDSYWVQNYHLNVGHHLIDPRVIRFNAGMAYSVLTSDTRPDTDTVSYSVSMNLLPGMIFSGSFYAQKSEQTIENTAPQADMDVETTSYGGILSLRLNSNIPGSNNNRRYWNNNNNNNNNGSAMQVLRRYFPDISVGYDHIESESVNGVAPLHETRDRMNADARYRRNSVFDVAVTSLVEEFEDIERNQKYELETNTATMNIHLSPAAVVRVSGSLSDKTYDNYFYTGQRSEESSLYSASLAIGERERLRQEYSYSYSDSTADSVPVASAGSYQQAKADLRYRMTQTINVNGGVYYQAKEYERDPDPLLPADKGFNETLNAAAVQGGILYSQQVKSESFGTWNLSSGYAGALGTNDFGNEIDPAASGSGTFYSNSITLGVGTGWGKEDISAGYGYLSSRDDSPLNNDFWSSSVSLRINTTRIPRTRIQGTGSYIVQDYSAEGGALFLQLPSVLGGSMQQQFRRALTYDLTVNYSVTEYLRLNAGANRGKSASKYTLSTLVPSELLVDDTIMYAGADVSYPVARNLSFLANLQREKRTANLSNVSTDTDRITTSFTYRLRKLFLTAEYRWLKSQPENAAEWVTERIYLTLKRPF